MANTSKTVIVTGGSQGRGSGAVQAFLDRDYNVVATSRNVTTSKDLPSSPKLALVEEWRNSIDVLVNAGIFFIKPFTDYTTGDFKRLVSTIQIGRGLIDSARPRCNERK